MRRPQVFSAVDCFLWGVTEERELTRFEHYYVLATFFTSSHWEIGCLPSFLPTLTSANVSSYDQSRPTWQQAPALTPPTVSIIRSFKMFVCISMLFGTNWIFNIFPGPFEWGYFEWNPGYFNTVFLDNTEKIIDVYIYTYISIVVFYFLY